MMKTHTALKIAVVSLYLVLGACASVDHNNRGISENETSLDEIVVTAAVVTDAQVSSQREIIPIVGNLYRARDNNHYTIFLVTSEGVILADPINTEFAKWLKEQIARQFDSEVKYVLYSHHHFDHASGGAVFADTADFVGHENMLAALAAPLPNTSVRLDVNGDAMLQRDEASGGISRNFDWMDINKDDQLTGAEINSHIVPPNLTYTDSYSVYLGGMEVQMHYSGEAHSDDGSILYFGEEAVVYAVDWLNLNRLPGNLYGTSLDGWIDSIDRAIALAPTRVSPGHGELGYRADLYAYKQFFVDLQTAVNDAKVKGLSAEEFAENLVMEDYQHWERYDSHLASNARQAFELYTP